MKAKGIEVRDGSYAQVMRKGCTLLGDAINLGQKGIARAKNEIDQKLEQMRQVIHEKTAPKAQSSPGTRKAKPASKKSSAGSKKRRSRG